MQSNKFIKPRNLWNGSRVSELSKARSFISEEDFEIEVDKIEYIIDKYMKSITDSELPVAESYSTFKEKQKLVSDTVAEIMKYFKNINENNVESVRNCLKRYITEYVTNYKNLLLDYGSPKNIRNIILNKCCSLVDKNRKINISHENIKDIKKISNRNGNLVVLFKDGGLYGCGANTNGEFGLGHKNPTSKDEFIKLTYRTVTDFTLEDEKLSFTASDGNTYWSGNDYVENEEKLNLKDYIKCGEYTDTSFNDDGSLCIRYKTGSKETNQFHSLLAPARNENDTYYPTYINDDGSISLSKVQIIESLADLQNLSIEHIDGEILDDNSSLDSNNKNKIIKLNSNKLILDRIPDTLNNLCFYLYVKGNYTIKKNNVIITNGSSTDSNTYELKGTNYFDNLSVKDTISIESDNNFYITWFVKNPVVEKTVLFFNLNSGITYKMLYNAKNKNSNINFKCNNASLDIKEGFNTIDFSIGNTDPQKSFKISTDYRNIILDASLFELNILNLFVSGAYLIVIRFNINDKGGEKIIKNVRASNIKDCFFGSGPENNRTIVICSDTKYTAYSSWSAGDIAANNINLFVTRKILTNSKTYF